MSDDPRLHGFRAVEAKLRATVDPYVPLGDVMERADLDDLREWCAHNFGVGLEVAEHSFVWWVLDLLLNAHEQADMDAQIERGWAALHDVWAATR